MKIRIKIVQFAIIKVISIIGLIVMLFAFASGGIQRVLAQSADDGWSDPVNLSASGAANDPVVVVDPNGLFHILWIDDVLGFVYTNGDGTTWSEPLAVSLPFDTYKPRLVADDSGYIHAFWRDDSDVLFHSRAKAREFEYYASWTTFQLSDSALDFDVEMDSEGRLHLAYVRPLEAVDLPSGIYYRQLSSGSANWSLQTLLYQSDYFRSLAIENSNVDIATSDVDGVANVFVAWDNRPRERVYLTRSIDGGDTWGEPVEVDKPGEGSVDSGPANIIVDADGADVLLLWQTARTEANCKQYYQWSTDGGDNWGVRQQMLEELFTCPQDADVLHTESGPVLMVTAIQVYLQAWDGLRWSDPQLQEALTTFVDAETQKLVSYSCRQPIPVGQVELLVVGCDGSTGRDIWLMKRPLTATDIGTWFPQEAVWSPLQPVISSDSRLLSPAVLADDSERVHIFWSQAGGTGAPGTGLSIYYTRWEAGQWSQQIAALTSPEGKADQPAVAINVADRLFAVWCGGLAGEIFFSQADASQAVVADAWSTPIRLPAPQRVGSSPDILIDQDGLIYVAYAIPLNEDRGVYLVRSEDAGQTWSEPVKVFDAVGAGWAMVDKPRLAITENGQLHILWTRFALPPDPAPLALFYSHSEDGGNSWTAPQPVEEEQVIWSEIVGSGKQIVQRVWQELSSGGTTLWHEQSVDGGSTWVRMSPVSIFGETVGTPSLAADDAGRLHLLQMVRRGPESFVLQYWLWDGERWLGERNLDMAIPSATTLGSLAADIASSGTLNVIFTVLTGSEEAGSQQDNLMFTYRLLDVPAGVITSTPLEPVITPMPTITPTQVSALEPSPTPIAEAQAATETPVFIPQEPGPSGNPWLRSIAGPLVAGGLILIVAVASFVVIKKRQK